MVSEILLRLLWSLAATTAITVTPFGLAQEVTGETKSGASGIDTPADARDDSGERIPDEITVIPKSEAGSSATSQKQDQPPAGNPRTVAPAVESGIASVYASELEGNLTASGERYDSQKLTAAHRTLPFGSRIRVVDPAAGKTVSVVVNDRWTGAPGQIVNLSRRAADVLGMQSVGQRQGRNRGGSPGRWTTPEGAAGRGANAAVASRADGDNLEQPQRTGAQLRE